MTRSKEDITEYLVRKFRLPWNIRLQNWLTKRIVCGTFGHKAGKDYWGAKASCIRCGVDITY